ncbi:MAG: hypothetical protein ACRCWF_09975 [Beijerinckiaceae bacterium]
MKIVIFFRIFFRFVFKKFKNLFFNMKKYYLDSRLSWKNGSVFFDHTFYLFREEVYIYSNHEKGTIKLSKIDFNQFINSLKSLQKNQVLRVNDERYQIIVTHKGSFIEFDLDPKYNMSLEEFDRFIARIEVYGN